MPPVIGTVAGDVGTSRGVFDIHYLLCDDPLIYPAPEEMDDNNMADPCDGLTVAQALTLEMPTLDEGEPAVVCTYDDDGGLSLTLPPHTGASPVLSVQLPGRGTQSLIDCYTVSGDDASTGAVSLGFPREIQQDINTHSAASTGFGDPLASCTFQITEDTRKKRQADFRLSGVMTCERLPGPTGDADILIPESKTFRYTVRDASFTVDCFYQ